MKKKFQILIYCFSLCLLTSCSSNDDTPPVPTGVTKSYELLNTNLSDLTGQVTFTENTNGSTTITVNLNNTVNGINNAVRIRNNTANIGGGIAVNLNDVNGNTGISETTISRLDNGEVLSYEEFSEFSGYLSIEGKDNNTGEFYAYADLGPNVLTGVKLTYNLFSQDDSINGLAVFEERKKGTTALTINIFQINENLELPTTLYIIQENNSELVVHSLATVKSRQNGYSFNEVSELDGMLIFFTDLIKLNGYIQITEVNNDMNILSEGAIGSHENASLNQL
ncbi:hypothetical protein [Maribacter spongiicola]|uniref:hypothetical protein n=1 Tax=Maribacter spongiicola TaxID=1206753 RepID=UPI003F993749